MELSQGPQQLWEKNKPEETAAAGVREAGNSRGGKEEEERKYMVLVQENQVSEHTFYYTP